MKIKTANTTTVSIIVVKSCEFSTILIICGVKYNCKISIPAVVIAIIISMKIKLFWLFHARLNINFILSFVE